MHHQDDSVGQDLSAANATEYKEAYKRGSDLVMRHIDLHDREPAAGPVKEAELREGIRCLQTALAIQPKSWPAHWLLGKGHQALGEHRRAYEAFQQATRLHTENADLPRELCLECFHLGKFPEAVDAARLAVRIERSNPGLQANLALALLLAGDVDKALDQAEQAVARGPEDNINRTLLAVIRNVKAGRRQPPNSLAELEG